MRRKPAGPGDRDEGLHPGASSTEKVERIPRGQTEIRTNGKSEFFELEGIRLGPENDIPQPGIRAALARLLKGDRRSSGGGEAAVRFGAADSLGVERHLGTRNRGRHVQPVGDAVRAE